MKSAKAATAAPSRDELRKLAILYLDRWERIVLGEMQRFFDRQRSVVLARLKGKQGRRGTRFWSNEDGTKGTKAINVAHVFDGTRWDAELQDLMSGLYAQLYQEQGDSIHNTFSVEGAFNLHDPAVTEAIGNRVDKIVGINQTTEDAVRGQISDGEAQGETIRSIADRVQSVFDDADRNRAVTIARTEVVGASNEAAFVAANGADLELTKEWLATQDERTREDHADVDGSVVALDEPFDVGGYEMMYPGDPDGPAEEVINCRCVLLYHAPEGDETISPLDGEEPPPEPE